MTTNKNQSPTPEQAHLAGSKAALAAKPGQAGIDPRGPRFGAGITALLLLTVIGLGLETTATLPTTIAQRAGQPAFLLLSAIALLFVWGAFAGIRRHPYGLLFKNTVRRALSAPTHLEDPRPPTFSQGVGLVVTVLGIVLHLAGVPYALVLFAAFAFIAAFLNAVFDYCLGCQLYVLLVRAGLNGRAHSAS
jgi:low affinity Fe/Cu permease